MHEQLIYSLILKMMNQSFIPEMMNYQNTKKSFKITQFPITFKM